MMLTNMKNWWQPSCGQQAADSSSTDCQCQQATSKAWSASLYSLGRRATVAMATAVAAAVATEDVAKPPSPPCQQGQLPPPPWDGLADPAARDRVRALARDPRALLRGPPAGSAEGGFQFDLDAALPAATAALASDEGLRRVRFELVPRLLSEEQFWRNYFYRVNLIQRSTQGPSLVTAARHQQQQQQQQVSPATSQVPPPAAPTVPASSAATSSCDSFEQVCPEDLEDLGDGSLASPDDPDWERDLQLELAGVKLAASPESLPSGGRSGPQIKN